MVLVLGVSRLLEMAKDTSGLRFIVVCKVFFQFISHSIVLQLQGLFQKHLSPINLEYQPLEVVRPSFLGYEPFSIYIVIRL
jgi:hypothetical protein